MRDIREIIIHCTATPRGRAVTVDELRRWHRAQGWSDVGYHYIIYLDGSVHAGRPLATPGAHCRGHNQHSIGVCYVGGLSSDGTTPLDTRTNEQRLSMTQLLRLLRHRFPNADIVGHCDINPAKACPCFNVRREFGGLIEST